MCAALNTCMTGNALVPILLVPMNGAHGIEFMYFCALICFMRGLTYLRVHKCLLSPQGPPQGIRSLPCFCSYTATSRLSSPTRACCCSVLFGFVIGYRCAARRNVQYRLSARSCVARLLVATSGGEAAHRDGTFQSYVLRGGRAAVWCCVGAAFSV